MKTTNSTFATSLRLRSLTSLALLAAALPDTASAATLYWNMQSALTNYPVMSHLFSRFAPGVDLRWLFYDAYQAVHSTGLHPAVLASKLSDSQLVVKFGTRVICGHTACALTSVYNTDYTLSTLQGTVSKVKPTEDIARTFGKMAMVSMGLDKAKPFVSSLGPEPPSISACRDALAAAITARRTNGLSTRFSFPAISDDCENLTQAILQKAEALRLTYASVRDRSVSGLAGEAELLAHEIGAATAGNPLFAEIRQEDHALMAPVLLRLGRLLESGVWSVALTVVSAKGAEYDSGPKGVPPTLCGHGTVISRVRDPDSKTWVHTPVEGTSYIASDLPSPPGYVSSLTIPLQDGTHRTFTLADAMTCLGQNMEALAGISQDRTILAHFQTDYPSLAACPFYVSAFYSGLTVGPGTIGCVPLDSTPPSSFASAGKSVFGAPVMGLSHPGTMALPVTSEMLGDTPETREATLSLLCSQIEELYCPPMDHRLFATLSSFWQPCAPLSAVLPRSTPHTRAEFSCAFDHPDDTARALVVYRHLADRFNDIQRQCPHGDGIEASAFGQYLSVSLRFLFPIPLATQKIAFTAVASMREAVQQLTFTPLTECPARAAHIDACAKVPSDHHFYMSQRGEGPVHSHRVRFA
jgi:hypothetical protein